MATTAKKIHMPGQDEIKDRMKHVGEAGAGPFIELLHNYRGNVLEVMDAIEDGLRAAHRKLSESGSKSTQLVANQFSSGADMIERLRGPVASGQKDDLFKMIESQGSDHQEMVFAASVIAGMIVGRIGRYSSQATEHMDPTEYFQEQGQNKDKYKEFDDFHTSEGEYYGKEFDTRGIDAQREREPDTFSIAGGYQPRTPKDE